MRTQATVYLLVLVVGNGGCSSDRAFRLPTAPTTPPAASAAAEWTMERWSLTTTYLGAVGLDACPSLGSPQIGASQLLTLTAARSGEVLVVSVANPANGHSTSYSGTTDGEVFSATTGIGGGSGITCGDRRVDFRDEARVAGRFSAGGRSLDADEVYTTWLASGETLTWHSKWQATRQ